MKTLITLAVAVVLGTQAHAQQIINSEIVTIPGKAVEVQTAPQQFLLQKQLVPLGQNAVGLNGLGGVQALGVNPCFVQSGFVNPGFVNVQVGCNRGFSRQQVFFQQQVPASINIIDTRRSSRIGSCNNSLNLRVGPLGRVRAVR